MWLLLGLPNLLSWAFYLFQFFLLPTLCQKSVAFSLRVPRVAVVVGRLVEELFCRTLHPPHACGGDIKSRHAGESRANPMEGQVDPPCQSVNGVARVVASCQSSGRRWRRCTALTTGCRCIAYVCNLLPCYTVLCPDLRINDLVVFGTKKVVLRTVGTSSPLSSLLMMMGVGSSSSLLLSSL